MGGEWKAAAQNSLIRPAVIHGVITGQADRCLQNWGPAERGFHGSRLKWRIKRTFFARVQGGQAH